MEKGRGGEEKFRGPDPQMFFFLEPRLYITLVTEASEASSLGGRTPTGHGEMIDKPPSMPDLLARDPLNSAV